MSAEQERRPRCHLCGQDFATDVEPVLAQLRKAQEREAALREFAERVRRGCFDCSLGEEARRLLAAQDSKETA